MCFERKKEDSGNWHVYYGHKPARNMREAEYYIACRIFCNFCNIRVPDFFIFMRDIHNVDDDIIKREQYTITKMENKVLYPDSF